MRPDRTPADGSSRTPIRRRRLASVMALAVAGATLVGACSRDGTAPERAASVSLSLAAPVELGDDGVPVLRDAAHELALDRVFLVVAEVGLSASGGGDFVETGPVLLEVPLDGDVRSLMAGVVAPARYDAVRIVLHAPDASDPADGVFLAAHPDFVGVSVRVEGRWDGAPFTWDLALDDLRTVTLQPPVDVWARTANVTLRLDVASWFRRDDGALVDPVAASGDGPLAAEVVSRIRASFAAFEDADADGTPSDD